MPDATLVIVPGHGNSGRRHWQSLLEAERPDTLRVAQRHWRVPVRRQWIAGLARTVAGAPRRPLLIGHSLGSMTIVEWGLDRATGAGVAGALLVAPPDLDRRLPGMPPRWMARLCGWHGVPLRALPFPSVLVASADDPFCSLERARYFAAAWGSRFVDLGPCGHIDSDAGFGPFPQLAPLIESLLG